MYENLGKVPEYVEGGWPDDMLLMRKKWEETSSGSIQMIPWRLDLVEGKHIHTLYQIFICTDFLFQVIHAYFIILHYADDL